MNSTFVYGVTICRLFRFYPLSHNGMKILKTVLNLLLSGTILLTSIGIPVSKHFCMDRLVEVRLFTSAIPCSYDLNLNSQDCPLYKDVVNHKPVKGCCHNTQTTIRITQLQNTYHAVELQKLFPVASMQFVPYISDLNNSGKPIHITGDLSPPDTLPDKIISFHSFLI